MVLNLNARRVQGTTPVGGVGANLLTKKKHLNSFLKTPEFVLDPECITKVKYKINHIWRTMNRTKKKTRDYKNPIQNIAHLLI